MRIGILRCGQSPEALRGVMADSCTLFERLLAGRGFTFSHHHVEAMEFPRDVHDADGWLITGSRHGVYEDHPFIPPLEAVIRRAHDEAVPLVGVCFGHQIIAKALGGEVIRRGWAVGAHEYDFSGEVLTLNAWHQDQVVRPPEGAVTIATSDLCRHAALVYDDRAFSVQAHPEMDDAHLALLMDHRVSEGVPAHLIASARERKGRAVSGAVLADRMEVFFKGRRPD